LTVNATSDEEETVVRAENGSARRIKYTSRDMIALRYCVIAPLTFNSYKCIDFCFRVVKASGINWIASFGVASL
jgi:hypothetical protein